MQNRYQTYFRDRALYYLSGDIYTQGEKGEEWEYKLTPVCGVFLMNFEWKDSVNQHLREDICLYNIHSHTVFSGKLHMIFIKIPMMDKDPEECKSTLDKWLYLLKNMDRMEAMPNTFNNDPVFNRLGKVARFAALNEKDKLAYKASLKTYRDNYAIAATERAEGRAEGIIEGAREKLRQMVAGLRRSGFDNNAIAGFLNESPETIAEI